MEVDESRRRKLGRAPGEGGVERALMVVIAVGFRGVFTADIDNCVAG